MPLFEAQIQSLIAIVTGYQHTTCGLVGWWTGERLLNKPAAGLLKHARSVTSKPLRRSPDKLPAHEVGTRLTALVTSTATYVGVIVGPARWPSYMVPSQHAASCCIWHSLAVLQSSRAWWVNNQRARQKSEKQTVHVAHRVPAAQRLKATHPHGLLASHREDCAGCGLLQNSGSPT